MMQATKTRRTTTTAGTRTQQRTTTDTCDVLQLATERMVTEGSKLEHEKRKLQDMLTAYSHKRGFLLGCQAVVMDSSQKLDIEANRSSESVRQLEEKTSHIDQLLKGVLRLPCSGIVDGWCWGEKAFGRLQGGLSPTDSHCDVRMTPVKMQVLPSSSTGFRRVAIFVSTPRAALGWRCTQPTSGGNCAHTDNKRCACRCVRACLLMQCRR
jgi:hypothetical protein